MSIPSSRRLVMVVILVLLALVPLTVAAGDGTVRPDAARVYVQFAPGQKEAVRHALASAGARFHYAFDALESFVVTVPARALQGLERNPLIVDVEADPPRYLAADPLERFIAAEGALMTDGQLIPYGVEHVQAPSVWAEGYEGVGRAVCVIDTGYYEGHEDLPTALGGTSQIPGEEWTEDGYGHGTHVAGTVAAANNDLGVVGVAYGADLFIVKIFDNDGLWVTRSSDLVAAAIWCADSGANIISMSLSGGNPNGQERRAFDALYAEGILSVAAASNDASSDYQYPASYDSVISVGAIDENYAHADFSNFNDQVELAAPGVNVLSTLSYITIANLLVDGVEYAGNGIEYAAEGTATGLLADGGRCLSTGAWTDMVVLCERGDISFYDKVMNVQNSGAVAAVIYNNEPGNFLGTLGDGNSSAIPAISLSQEDGQYLVANELGQEGTVTNLVDAPASGYEYWGGTSMATPHVAGAAALVWSANPAWTNVEIRTALQLTAMDLGDPGRDDYFGFGLVQAADALAMLQNSGGAGSMHVSAIDMIYTATGRNRNIYTEITIAAFDGTPVPNATVAVTLELPHGSETVAFNGVTDAAGQVTFLLRSRETGVYRATVTDVTHAVLVYAPGDNLETTEHLHVW